MDYREKSSESSLYKQLDFATDFASHAARIGNLVFCIFEKHITITYCTITITYNNIATPYNLQDVQGAYGKLLEAVGSLLFAPGIGTGVQARGLEPKCWRGRSPSVLCHPSP